MSDLIDSPDGGGRPPVPLAGVEPNSLAGRFTFWEGRSGKRYLFTRFSPEATPDLSTAIMLFVRGSEEPRRIAAVAIGRESANVPRRLAWLLSQTQAQEVHVHFLAFEEAERRAAAIDLAAPLDLAVIGF
jgi:hypothetical protein